MHPRSVFFQNKVSNSRLVASEKDAIAAADKQDYSGTWGGHSNIPLHRTGVVSIDVPMFTKITDTSLFEAGSEDAHKDAIIVCNNGF